MENIYLKYYGDNILDYEDNLELLKKYYHIDNTHYKEVRNVIYKDLEKFYNYVMPTINYNDELKKEIETLLDNFDIYFDLDMDYFISNDDLEDNPIFTQILINDEFVCFDYYEKFPILYCFAVIEDLIENKTTVILNKNFKEIYFIKSELNHFNGKQRRRQVIRYQINDYKVSESIININATTDTDLGAKKISKIKKMIDKKII